MPRPSGHQDQQDDVLQVLYPWYKEEVFRRREQMVRLTALATAFLVLVLLTFTTIPLSLRPHPAFTGLSILGILLFSGTFAYLIWQHRTRHLMAKHTLIEIERLLGLYQEGLYRPGPSLYPADWQTAWSRDRSMYVYLTILTTLTILDIAAILLRTSS